MCRPGRTASSARGAAAQAAGARMSSWSRGCLPQLPSCEGRLSRSLTPRSGAGGAFADRAGQHLDAAAELVGAEVAVGEHEAGGAGRLAVVGDAGDQEAAPGGLGDDGGLVDGGRLDVQVHAGGFAADGRLGQVVGQQLEQAVAAAPVAGTVAADVALVAAGGEQLGEGGLLEDRRHQVDVVLVPRGLGGQVGRDDQPAEAQARRERLGGAAAEQHAVGGEALQGRDRLVVVAVLGDVAVDQVRPGEQAPPPGGAEDHAGGELVGRGGEHGAQRPRHRGARVAGGLPEQAVGIDPVAVDGDPDGVQAVHLELRRGVEAARVLDADGVDAAPPEQAGDHGQALGEPVDHHEVVRGDDRSSHSPEVVGQGLAEAGQAPAVAVAERGVGQLRQRAPDGALPLRPGEAGQVGRAGAEVDGDGTGGFRGGPSGRGGGRRRVDGGDAGGGAPPGDQVALGAELLVGEHHDAARDTEVGGEGAGRRQGGVGAQAPGADGVAEPALQLQAQPAAGSSGEVDQQLARTGLLRTRIGGPVHQSTVRRTVWPMQAADRAAMGSAALGITAVGAGIAVSSWLTAYPVLTAQAVRYGLAAVILAVVARGRGRPEPRGTVADWVRILVVAATGMALFNVAVVRAVTTGEPAVVATVVGCAPVLFALVVPALERRRPAARVVAGACLVAAGAAVVEGFGTADAAALAWSAVALACEVGFTVVAAPVLSN